MLTSDHTAYSGKCDGCGAVNVPIMKVSLGRDFFGRAYDRLSPAADVSPKWYCEPCSIQKSLQRDFRDIRKEFDALSNGGSSVLADAEQLERARVRLNEIAARLSGATLPSILLKPEEVVALARSLETRRSASLT